MKAAHHHKARSLADVHSYLLSAAFAPPPETATHGITNSSVSGASGSTSPYVQLQTRTGRTFRLPRSAASALDLHAIDETLEHDFTGGSQTRNGLHEERSTQRQLTAVDDSEPPAPVCPPLPRNGFHGAPAPQCSGSQRHVFTSVADLSDDDDMCGATGVSRRPPAFPPAFARTYPPAYPPADTGSYYQYAQQHANVGGTGTYTARETKGGITEAILRSRSQEVPFESTQWGAERELKGTTEDVLRSRSLEVLAERHELSQQASSLRVTAAYRNKRVEATVKETQVIRSKIAGENRRLEKVQSQFDATRIARAAAARELAVLRQIVGPAATSDSDGGGSDDESDAAAESGGEKDDASVIRRRREGRGPKTGNLARDAAWQRAELRRVLQEMARALEKTEKRARSAIARTTELEDMLEDRKEQLAGMRSELRATEGERDMLADELEEALNSWARPRAEGQRDLQEGQWRQERQERQRDKKAQHLGELHKDINSWTRPYTPAAPAAAVAAAASSSRAEMTSRVASAPPQLPQRLHTTASTAVGMWLNESRTPKRISRSGSREDLATRVSRTGISRRGGAGELQGWAHASALHLAGQMEPRVPGYLRASLEVP